MDMTKALTCIIDELVDDRDLKETIISYVPKDEKRVKYSVLLSVR